MNDSKNATTDLLNRLIGGYWSGYAQHKAHVALVDSWGLEGLATAMRTHIDDEPETITALLERLLDLGGQPDFTIATPQIGVDLKQVLHNDYEAQVNVRPALNSAAEQAAAAHDATTRSLLEQILKDEEAHLNWLATEVELYERLGDSLYVANRLN
ncbi:ferritin-like domain-containing protein [Williamsia sp. R60]